MNILEKARIQRANILKSALNLDDEAASATPEFFATLKGSGELISAGTRINWYGVLKRAAVDLYDTSENNPDNAPTLWEDIIYKDGIRVIPSVISSGSAFAKDEQGWWQDVLYVSLLDNNVWTPESYPSGWAVVT